MKSLWLLLLLPLLVDVDAKGQDAILLQDISVLTLYEGRMTNGRRSAGVPQLKCTGGTAKGKFVPKVVQCYNRGFDGYDVQWECKTDMDNEYRFGNIAVTCEGYDSPNDPYVLRGSCGLEYELDYSKAGWEKKDQNNYGYGSGSGSGGYDYSTKSRKSGTGFGDLLFFAVVIIFIYVLYKTCISPPEGGRGGGGGGGPYGGDDRGGGNPPPPGFRPGYGDDDADCHRRNQYPNASAPPPQGAQAPRNDGNNGPGFWAGMAGGGLLGYLMGGNRGYGGGYGGYQRRRGWFGNDYDNYGGGGWFDDGGYNGGGGWGGGGFGGGGGGWGGGGGGSGGGGSSGTRSASGFGGTNRR